MRALSGLLILAALAAVPSSAHAQTPMCRIGTPDANATIEFQKKLGTYLGASSEYSRGGLATVAAEEVLGAQFTLLWADNYRQGWTVAYSPGTHDATSARAAIRSHLSAGVAADTVDYLDSTLLLVPTPYSLAELRDVMAQVFPLLTANGVNARGGISCGESDAVRVELDVVGPDTPELRAQVEGLLAPFGDKVRATYGHAPVMPMTGAAPVNPPRSEQQQRPTLKVRDYVSLSRTSRCARTVSANPRAGKGVKRVRLTVGKRASAGKSARIKLTSRRSEVTVTVTLTDGTAAVETLTYRRCG